MRSGLMRLIPALLAVLALGAVVASAAQAIEGVHFKVAGARLGEGQSKEITSEAGRVEVGYWLGGSHCSTAVAPGAKIFGSAVESSSTGELELEFKNCEGSGKCAVIGSVKSKPLKLTLGATEGSHLAEKSGALAAWLKPASGVTFFNLKPKECSSEELIEGDLAVTIDSGNDKVGEETPEAKTVELTMPYRFKKFEFIEKGEGKEDPYPGLSGAEGELSLAGSIKLQLASGENWGVFQKH